MAQKAQRAPTAPRTFLEASREIQDNLQKHLAKYDQQLDGDEIDTDEEGEEEEEVAEELVVKVLAGYSSSGDAALGASARAALRSALQSLACLICIETVKKTEAIWSCGTCHVSFHIACIQKWAKDSIFQQRQQQEEESGPVAKPTTAGLQWSCPKCR
jgi:NF-X1-type zinc finger protein NFXL1